MTTRVCELRCHCPQGISDDTTCLWYASMMHSMHSRQVHNWPAIKVVDGILLKGQGKCTRLPLDDKFNYCDWSDTAIRMHMQIYYKVSFLRINRVLRTKPLRLFLRKRGKSAIVYCIYDTKRYRMVYWNYTDVASEYQENIVKWVIRWSGTIPRKVSVCLWNAKKGSSSLQNAPSPNVQIKNFSFITRL